MLSRKRKAGSRKAKMSKNKNLETKQTQPPHQKVISPAALAAMAHGHARKYAVVAVSPALLLTNWIEEAHGSP